MSEEYDYLFKSIVVGDGGVGKTALTLRFSKGFFQEKYKMTIGVDFHVKTIEVETDNGLIRTKLQIWDTGGQERFASIRPMYYRGALGALLIFDLTNGASFEHLPQWIEEVRANAKEEIPLLLVGNKDDLVDQRMVSLEEINDFTRDFNLYYMETSAKTGDHVGDCFYILACLMIGEGVPEKIIEQGTIYAPGRIPISPKEEALVSPEEVGEEMEYEAPPIPEPEPEIEYEAPPIPEPEPILEATPEPSSSKPPEFDFKTPDEVLAENNELQQEAADISSMSDISEPPKMEEYKPKSIPFSASAPVPTKGPSEFVSEQPAPQPVQQSAPTNPIFQRPVGSESKSLYDYFPSIRPEPEVEETIEEEQEPRPPSLFETLSQKKGAQSEVKTSAFIPFVSPMSEESSETEASTIEAIPNIEDIEASIPAAKNYDAPTKKSRSGVVICPNCGATLSGDYQFCNRCGTKLS